MGLDAYVPCSCLRRGTTKTPCPVEVSYEYGIPYPREVDLAVFSAWQNTACEHARMQALDERVGNWAAVRRLQDALDQVEDPCSMLRTTLPDSNGGIVEVATCRRCLEELEMFKLLFRRITPRLVNAVTGAEAYNYVAAYEGAFVWGQDGVVGFDDQGLYVSDPRTGGKRFCAKRVTATPLDDKHVELRDLDGGATCRCAWPHEVETPYEVIHHVESAADHEPTLTTLEGLFRAAIEHDTCVVWC